MKTSKKILTNWLGLLGLIGMIFCCNSAWAATDPTITWNIPVTDPAFSYGDPLTPTQLGATANVPGTFSYTPSVATQIKQVGAVTLSAVFTPTDTANYNTVTVTRTLTVARRQILISPESTSRYYGDANPTSWASVTPVGALPEDQLTAVVTSSAKQNSVPGTYPLTYQLNDPLGKSANYIVFLSQAELKIEKRPVFLVPTPKTITYGTTVDAKLAGTIVGPNGGQGIFKGKVDGTDIDDGITAEFELDPTKARNGSLPVGSYDILVISPVVGSPGSGIKDPNGKLGNYQFRTVTSGNPAVTSYVTETGKLTVNKAELHIYAGDRTGDKGILYGTSVSTIPWDATIDRITGAYVGDCDPANLVGGQPSGVFRFSFTLGGVNMPGYQAIVPQLIEQGTGNRLANYDPYFHSGALLIKKGNYTVTMSAPTGLTYYDQLGANPINASVKGLDGGAPVGAINFIFNNAPAAGQYVDVGTGQKIYLYVAGTDYYNEFGKDSNGNYNQFVTFSVAKAPTTITWAAPAAISFGTKIEIGKTLNATRTGKTGAPVQPEAISYSPLPNSYPIYQSAAHSLTAFVPANDKYDGAVFQVSLTVNNNAKAVITSTDYVIPTSYSSYTVSAKATVGPDNIPAATPFGTATTKAKIRFRFYNKDNAQIGSNSGDANLITIDGSTGIATFTLSAASNPTLAAVQAAAGPVTLKLDTGDDGGWKAASQVVKNISFGKVPLTFDANSLEMTYADPENLSKNFILSGKLNGTSLPLNGKTVNIAITAGQGTGVNIALSTTVVDAAGNFSLDVRAALRGANGGDGLQVIQSPYVITYTLADDSSFSATALTKSIIVNKAPLRVTPVNQTKKYGDVFTGTLTCNIVGLLSALSGPDSAEIDATGSTEVKDNSTVGQYTIVPTLIKKSTSTLTDAEFAILRANYLVTMDAGIFTVTKAPLKITAEDKNKPLNAAMPTFTKKYEGFKFNDGPSVLKNDATPTLIGYPSDESTLVADVSKFVIQVSRSTTADNYEITPVDGWMYIKKASATLVYNAPSAITYGTRTFAGQRNASATVGGVADTEGKLPITYTIIGGPDGGNIKLVGATFNDAFDASANGMLVPGAYTITATCTPDTTKYPGFGPVTQDVTLTVRPAELVIQLKSVARDYLALNSTVQNAGKWEVAKYYGFIPGESETGVWSAFNSGGCGLEVLPTPYCAATDTSVAGSYEIIDYDTVAAKATAKSSKYNITYIKGALTVNKIDMAINWGITASPGILFNYGVKLNETDHLNATKAAPTVGLLTGIAPPDCDVSYNKPKDTILEYNKDGHDLTVTFTPKNLAASTYKATSKTIKVMVGKKLLTATFQGVLANTTTDAAKAVLGRTYGNNNPAYDQAWITITGFAYDQTKDSVGLTLGNTSAVDSIAGGTYYVKILQSPNNYDIQYANGQTANNATGLNYEIRKRDLTPVINGVTRAYGQTIDNSIFSGSLQGLAPIDNGIVTIKYTCSAVAGNPPGTYPISADVTSTVSGKLLNYNIKDQTTPAYLTITKAVLQIKIDDKTKQPGKENPAFTYTVTSGLASYKLSDTVITNETVTVIQVAPTFQCPATTSSGTGTYDITKLTDGVAQNYSFAYTKGTLTIIPNRAPKAPTITYNRTADNTIIKIFTGKLLSFCTDEDKDTLSIVYSGTINTAGGGTVSKDQTGLWLVYFGKTGSTADDSFSYTISDGQGGTATGTILIKVRETISIPDNMFKAEFVGSKLSLYFMGIPGAKYKVQATDKVTDPNSWFTLPVDTTTVPSNAGRNTPSAGLITLGADEYILKYVDVDAGNYQSRFYRAVFVP